VSLKSKSVCSDVPVKRGRTGVIRPVWIGDVLSGYALCKEHEVMIPSDVLRRFDMTQTATTIRRVAKECGITEIEWGNPLVVESES